TEAEARDSGTLMEGRAFPIVIPNGIDPSLRTNVATGRFRHAHPNFIGKKILLFSGRLHPSKGLELQLHALAVLVKQFPQVMWVLVGPDQGMWARLRHEACSLGLESYVFRTGLLPHEQCLEALADADVLLLTSHHEAHSMAMNEALCLGVPIVMTDTLHFKEVQEAGAGYVVPWDPGSLAAAVADILQHHDRAVSMRQAGLRLVTDRLAWPKVADAMVRAYEHILAASGRMQAARTSSCR
ncbi:MAG TPA: glycosyltransferase, partial [Nitrospiraceae bacterium]|nr:glycosyltransferase [Nitrospiraceae bacterium]